MKYRVDASLLKDHSKARIVKHLETNNEADAVRFFKKLLEGGFYETEWLNLVRTDGGGYISIVKVERGKP